MSEGETFALLAAAIVSAVTWLQWSTQAASAAPRCSTLRHRWPLLFYPVAGAWIVYEVLQRFSSLDVREDPVYLWFYLVLGTAWMGLAATGALPFFGLNARDDVIERANTGAAHAIGGALLGVALCYAGGNIGNGPGWRQGNGPRRHRHHRA